MRTHRRIRAGLGALLVAAVACVALPAAPVRANSSPAEVLPPMERLDLNSASLAEIEALPIPDSLARAIYEHRENLGFFVEFYDLWQVEGMTPEHMRTLRGLVSTIEPPRRDEALERYDESFNQVERFLSQEGASEEIADELLDALRDPQNVNDLSLYELQSYQNVSPVDAVAIVKGRKRLGAIEEERAMRNLEGLSYWGFRNLRNFVEYEKQDRDLRLHGDLQFISFNTPYSRGGDETDIIAQAFLNDSVDRLTSANPAMLTKLRLRLGNELKGGVMTWRDVAETDLDETVKGYVTWQPDDDGQVRVDKVVLGNYRVAFGQGLVMDNTDFFLPRKTGYGWNKRPQTIYGDLGRSNTFALQGGAAEFSVGRLHGIGFASWGHKDGLVNVDPLTGEVESYNRYVVMTPRFEQEVLDESGAGSVELRRNAIEEEIIGGNLKLELFPGTFVGASAYEARYDLPFDPQVTALFSRPDLLQARDSELYSDYSSEAVGGDFRRVVGTEFQAVYENVALQGEYAKLDNLPKGQSVLTNSAPDAFLVNGYVQYGDFNLLALYRDYDVGFDNPYARAFSNDTRYEQTLLGDPFRLNDELFSYLAVNTPQMKPERGIFLSTRYRISRNLTITGLDYDKWTRVADGQDMTRYTLRMEYAPIWPLRFRLRQRFSSRGEQIDNDVRRFRSWDTRLEARVRLSGFDELRLLYSATNTEFAPRPRLSETPTGGDSSLPQGASPGQALQAQYRHNVNENLMLMFSSLVYDGFLWNFEDNEFVLLDGTGFRNWMMVRSRISDNLLLRFKFTTDRLLTQSSVLYGRDDIDLNGNAIGDEVRGLETSFRLQLDYTF